MIYFNFKDLELSKMIAFGHLFLFPTIFGRFGHFATHFGHFSAVSQLLTIYGHFDIYIVLEELPAYLKQVSKKFPMMRLTNHILVVPCNCLSKSIYYLKYFETTDYAWSNFMSWQNDKSLNYQNTNGCPHLGGSPLDAFIFLEWTTSQPNYKKCSAL